MSGRAVRRLCLLGVALLFAVSIPWYRQTGADPQLWLGLPDWVTVALGCYALAAVLNAVAWRHTGTEPAASRDPAAGSEAEQR